METISSKIAVVTGGTRGIGLAVVKELLQRGAKVLFTARHPKGLDEVREDLARCGFSGFRGAVAHSGREPEVAAAFAEAVRAFGGVDIAVNNAATNPAMAPLLDLDLALFDKVIATNLRGYLVVAREAVRSMRETGRGGAIVNISSVAAHRVVPGLGAYAISKAGVEALTRTLAVELAPERIRVNAVAPGIVRTRFSEALWSAPEAEERMLEKIPLGRLGDPREVARAVAFLVSGEAGYITGATLVADGGLLAS